MNLERGTVGPFALVHMRAALPQVLQAPLDGVFHVTRAQQATARIEAEHVFDGPAHTHVFIGEAEDLLISGVPRHQFQVGIDHADALRQVFQAALSGLRGLVGCGNHAVLRRTQGGGMMRHHLLQLFTAALAQARQAPALLEEQAEQDHRQPGDQDNQRRMTPGDHRRMRIGEQVKSPGLLWHRQGTPDHVVRQRRRRGPDPLTTVAQWPEDPASDGRQGAAAVLTGRIDVRTRRFRQRTQAAIAPCTVAVVQENHAVRIRQEHDVVAALLPVVGQGIQGDLEHDHAQALARIVLDGLRDEITCHVGGHAYRIKSGMSVAHCILEVRPETVIDADIAGRGIPVVGGDGPALMIQQGQRGRVGRFVGPFHPVVEVAHLLRGCGCRQRSAQVRIERQHRR